MGPIPLMASMEPIDGCDRAHPIDGCDVAPIDGWNARRWDGPLQPSMGRPIAAVNGTPLLICMGRLRHLIDKFNGTHPIDSFNGAHPIDRFIPLIGSMAPIELMASMGPH